MGAAIDLEALAGDVAGGGAAEKAHGSGDQL
jgi:hypothetical protein